jgi:hypothetical protein
VLAERPEAVFEQAPATVGNDPDVEYDRLVQQV